MVPKGYLPSVALLLLAMIPGGALADGTIQSPPQNLSGSIDGDQQRIVLVWDAPPDAGPGTIYHVYRDGIHIINTASTRAVDVIAPDPLTDTALIVYHVTASSKNGENQSPPSNPLIVAKGPCSPAIVIIEPGSLPPVAMRVDSACIEWWYRTVTDLVPEGPDLQYNWDLNFPLRPVIANE